MTGKMSSVIHLHRLTFEIRDLKLTATTLSGTRPNTYGMPTNRKGEQYPMMIYADRRRKRASNKFIDDAKSSTALYFSPTDNCDPDNEDLCSSLTRGQASVPSLQELTRLPMKQQLDKKPIEH